MVNYIYSIVVPYYARARYIHVHVARPTNADWPGAWRMAMALLHSSMTARYEYHYKGHEPYVQLLHAVYARFDTLPLSFYILLSVPIL